MRPEATQTRASIHAGVYYLGPFAPVTKFQKDPRSQGQRLGARDAQVGPVKVKARLDLVLDLARGCAGHEAPALPDGRIDPSAQVDGIRVLKGPLRLEVDINKEFENFRFLFNDVESGAARQVGQVRPVEFIKVLVGHVKLPAVHEHVGRRVLALFHPFLNEHDLEEALVSKFPGSRSDPVPRVGPLRGPPSIPTRPEKTFKKRLDEGFERLLGLRGLRGGGWCSRGLILLRLYNLFNFVVHLHDGHILGKRLGVGAVLTELGEALGNGNL